MGLPGLTRQTFTVTRQTVGEVDDEGHAWSTWTVLGTFTGSWGTPGVSDLSVSNRRGERIDAIVATASYLNGVPGDRIEDLQGRNWDVISVEPLPVVQHVRVMLRQVD